MRGLIFSDLKRVGVFRALNLGDLLCAMPSFRALRHALPHADIRLIGLAHMAPLAHRFSHYISSFSSFPGFPGLPEQSFDLDAFTRFTREEARCEYDLVIQMHGKGSITNPLVCMLGAARTAGYYEPGEFQPDEDLFMPYPEGMPEVERHLRLVDFLGIERRGTHLEFPIFSDDWTRLAALQRKHGFGGEEYVCIHPGARDVRRWWAPAKFAQVADALREKGYGVIFTGSAEEATAIEHVRASMTHDSTSLAGLTDLGTLAALVAKARLLVSNDTGVSHVAAATCTPSVVVFLASDPARWAPLDRDTHRIVTSSNGDVEGVMTEAEVVLSRPSDERRTYLTRNQWS